mmetsp:Transcript_101089/g.324735  ORF Transcript_101089/g.324735 Transcript_101089/m.324735 type:complete len:203 (-) Transcript_101089:142-750(-)|eukprot:CAMPEP_0204119702 /NCGR_PEP_ID=MMETSP0361-20130328/7261_1 /ASSEMBLY_ACC=CAM_ASM_000343 /TAXON_ID=268821 /ORGANISM="Scrippsiella Hangoei, Strain SHTV-5" /LENGTH=202 /DNA_ID=CAMNT_0051070871 /DNA_START=30 /DNA_END=638 /DNA_ORIENTATION=-
MCTRAFACVHNKATHSLNRGVKRERPTQNTPQRHRCANIAAQHGEAATSACQRGKAKPDATRHVSCERTGLVAARTGVQRCPHMPLIVHKLQDVELAPRGPNMIPILAVHPKGRPRTTTGGHVLYLHHEQTCIVHCGSLDANGLAAVSRLGCTSRSKMHTVRGSCRQATRDGLFPVQISDSAMRRVRRIPKLPSSKEVLTHI